MPEKIGIKLLNCAESSFSITFNCINFTEKKQFKIYSLTDFDDVLLLGNYLSDLMFLSTVITSGIAYVKMKCLLM